MIVLPELDRFQAVTVLDRLRLRLAGAHPGETARFTASFGVADSKQSDAVDPLVQIADCGPLRRQAGRSRPGDDRRDRRPHTGTPPEGRRRKGGRTHRPPSADAGGLLRRGPQAQRR